MLFKCVTLIALALAVSAAPTSPPSPELRGLLKRDGFTSQVWTEAFQKAQALVANLSLDQKQNFTALRPFGVPGCSGTTYPLPEAGINEGLCYADGPTGESPSRTRFHTSVVLTYLRMAVGRHSIAILHSVSS